MQNRIDADVIVETPFVLPDDDVRIFADNNGVLPVPVARVPESATMLDILVQTGISPSKNEARRIWPAVAKKHGIDGESTRVPDGFTLLTIGKPRHSLGIWKPTT